MMHKLAWTCCNKNSQYTEPSTMWKLIHTRQCEFALANPNLCSSINVEFHLLFWRVHCERYSSNRKATGRWRVVVWITAVFCLNIGNLNRATTSTHLPICWGIIVQHHVFQQTIQPGGLWVDELHPEVARVLDRGHIHPHVVRAVGPILRQVAWGWWWRGCC